MFDPSVIHRDTLFFLLLCAAIVLVVLHLAARKATSAVPGRFQAAVEMLVEMVNEQANALVRGNTSYIAPLALTVFCWVALMNAASSASTRATREKHEIATAEAELAAISAQLQAIQKLRKTRR